MKLSPKQYKQIIKIAKIAWDWYEENDFRKRHPKVWKLGNDYHYDHIFAEAIYGTMKDLDNVFTKAFS